MKNPRMSINKIFSNFALLAVITASVFGICSVQHTSLQANAMEIDTVLVGSGEHGSCPLGSVADFQPTEKYAQADPGVFWQNISPSGAQRLVTLKLAPVDFEYLTINRNEAKWAGSEIPISITSPPLAEAFSQGILHPKKDSIA